LNTRELVPPHGGSLVNRVMPPWLAERAQERVHARRLQTVTLTPLQLADLELIAIGAYSPLQGFLAEKDYRSVVDDMRLANGLPWSLPITLRWDGVEKGGRIGDELALLDDRGVLRGVLQVSETYRASVVSEAQAVYGTEDPAHPGVARLLQEPDRIVAGDVSLVERWVSPFPALALDPVDTRRTFADRGWSTVVGFQTRNPVHRAHEYIQKAALETVDGLLLHPLVGTTKGDDVPADVRVASYRVLIDQYYPADRVVLAAFPAAMRYAGPREAVFHAIARKNYGCSHFIVGRDHAGVGSYYGTYDAQRIFERFEAGELGIVPVKFEHTFYCRKCETVASSKTCPHDPTAHVALSGTEVRSLLRRGELPPPQFSRPEVAAVLAQAFARGGP
jgi:sulfate adenylyltransferase